MIRVLLYVGLVGLVALGAAWLADRPGTILLTWQGWQVQTNLMVAIVAVAALVIAVMLVWILVSALLRAPDAFDLFLRGRRRSRGIASVSRGLVAVGVGDTRRAVREAAEARRYLGADPLALLLQAQAAQLSGDRGKAESAFSTLLEAPETRALGLRGLFVEAERRGDHAAARRIAADAARDLPEAGWALDALFAFHCSAGQWKDARDVVERLRSARALDRDAAERRRAVLLTAEAQDRAASDPAEARAQAQEAHKLAPDLIPAAVLAARLLIDARDGRRAAKIAETTFRKEPHPELADLYVQARAGESARERLARAETLAARSGSTAEGQLAVARAAIDARDFARARGVLEPLLGRPTARVCLLMSEIEENEFGDVGRAREWLSRALHAAGDPAWVADGAVADRWMAVAPATGAFDAFRWQVPPASFSPAAAPAAAIAATERLIAATAPPPVAEAEKTAAAVGVALVEDGPPVTVRPDTPAAEPMAATEKIADEGRPSPSVRRPASAVRTVLPLPRPPDDPGPTEDELASQKGRAISLG